QETVRASAIFFTGAFVALSLAGIRSLATRAIAAVAIAALLTAAWFVVFHLRYVDLQQDFELQMWDGFRSTSTKLQLPATPPALDGSVADAIRSSDITQRLAAVLASTATLFPALLASVALLGVRLAWGWYYHIARRPLAAPARPFRDFRFNDQMIWVLVLTLAAALMRLGPGIDLACWNVLAVVIGLYAMRGLAVVTTALVRASPVFIAVLIVLMLPMFAFALVGCTLLGIADTWVDLRRRRPPAMGAVA
ncbi:MAG: DUF2232 domain-containing protein, partial [Gemmatimonadales bacterium]